MRRKGIRSVTEMLGRGSGVPRASQSLPPHPSPRPQHSQALTWIWLQVSVSSFPPAVILRQVDELASHLRLFQSSQLLGQFSQSLFMGLGEARVGVKPESPGRPSPLKPIDSRGPPHCTTFSTGCPAQTEAGSPWESSGARLSAGLAAV